jgi:hypothetical protein
MDWRGEPSMTSSCPPLAPHGLPHLLVTLAAARLYTQKQFMLTKGYAVHAILVPVEHLQDIVNDQHMRVEFVNLCPVIFVWQAANRYIITCVRAFTPSTVSISTRLGDYGDLDIFIR